MATDRASPAAAAPSSPGDGRWRELITPEGVDLRLRLGEASERATAFLLDAVFIMLGVFVVVVVGLFAGFGAMAAKNQVGAELIFIALTLIFFLARIAYFIAFELTPRAATPGKRLSGLRVAARNGGRLTADMVFARNFMREFEVFVPLTFLLQPAQGADAWTKLLALIWCAVFVFFPVFNRDRLRVGDLVAGTWVVKAPKRKLDSDLADTRQAPTSGYVFTLEQLDAYGIKELHVLEEVLRRRDRRTLAEVASRIRGKIAWVDTPHEFDADFLAAYYVALRGRLEGRLLMGRRRKDKFDRD
jgi:uncharacterized RDD family membrane protein YckC